MNVVVNILGKEKERYKISVDINGVFIDYFFAEYINELRQYNKLNYDFVISDSQNNILLRNPYKFDLSNGEFDTKTRENKTLEYLNNLLLVENVNNYLISLYNNKINGL